MLSDKQMKQRKEKVYKVVNRKGKILEKFRQVVAARRWIVENQLWVGELKIEKL